MKKARFVSLAAYLLLLLGILHLLANLFAKPDDPAFHELLTQMDSYEIEMLRTHSVLKFYYGFSVTMGALLILYSTLIIVLSPTIVANQKICLMISISTFVLLALTIFYFHFIAQFLAGLAFLTILSSHFIKESRV